MTQDSPPPRVPPPQVPQRPVQPPRSPAGKTPPVGGAARSPYGPQPLGALIPRLTKPAFRRKSPGAAMLLADWAQVVGPELAATTTPRRFAAGTLTIACAGPVAMELQHLAPQLLGRINGHLGQLLVERLRFVQADQARPSPPPRPPAPALPEPVAEALAAVADEGLRAALAKLGRGVYRGRP